MKLRLLFFSIIVIFTSCATNNKPDELETDSKTIDRIESKRIINDGLYLITKIDTIAAQLSPLSSNEAAIFFNKLFDEYNSEEYLRLVIDTTEYVPIQLEKAPVAEQQTNDKKKLLLSFTKEASENLKAFTAAHLTERVALVVDGNALTMHKIMVPITSGQLQISRCNDNACELLFVALKDNVVED